MRRAERGARTHDVLQGTPVERDEQVKVREPVPETRILERVHFRDTHPMPGEDPEHRIELRSGRLGEHRSDAKDVPRFPGHKMKGWDEEERQECDLENMET